jgi:hypothetical protein
VARAIVYGLVTVVTPVSVAAFVAPLIAALALVQYSTAWTHIAIGAPQPDKAFWRRLPPLRKTFEATCFPTLIVWFAGVLAAQAPLLMSTVLGIPAWDPRTPGVIPAPDASWGWKAPIIFVVTLLIQVLVVIPANVALIRVQASLLPVDEDAVVPFDRSFKGKVEPAIVGGKGFVTMKDALATFSRQSWIRLYVLNIKVFFVIIATHVLLAAIVIPEILLMARKE